MLKQGKHVVNLEESSVNVCHLPEVQTLLNDFTNNTKKEPFSFSKALKNCWANKFSKTTIANRFNLLQVCPSVPPLYLLWCFYFLFII